MDHVGLGGLFQATDTIFGEGYSNTGEWVNHQTPIAGSGSGSGTFPYIHLGIESQPQSPERAKDLGALWMPLTTVNGVPFRAAHCCELIGDSHLAVFGGWNGTDALCDFYVLRLHDLNWIKIEALDCPSKRNNVSFSYSATSPRLCQHSSAAFGHRLYIHGGHDGSNWLSDLYSIDLMPIVHGEGSGGLQLSWSKPVVNGRFPRPRACHTLSRVKKKLYMFGGYDGNHCFNDVEILDLESHNWVLAPVRGSIPEGRNAHSMTVVNTALFLCGGHAGKQHTTDLFVFETTTFTWTEITASGAWPPGLRGHTATLVGDQMVLFGGYDGKTRNNDLYLFDVPDRKWSRLVERGQAPCGRQRHSATQIAPTKLLLFGGFNGSTWMNDAFLLNLSPLIWRTHRHSTLMQLASNMKLLVDNKDFSDVVFLVGSDARKVYAHRCVLSAQSDYFKNMFSKAMVESVEQEISMREWTYSAFRTMLEFLYTGGLTANRDIEHLCDAMCLADYFDVVELRIACEQELVDMITTMNVCDILKKADASQATLLKDKCLSFVFDHADDVMA